MYFKTDCKIGMRVKSASHIIEEDSDEGVIRNLIFYESGNVMAEVVWDSGVVTPCPLEDIVPQSSIR